MNPDDPMTAAHLDLAYVNGARQALRMVNTGYPIEQSETVRKFEQNLERMSREAMRVRSEEKGLTP